MLVIHIGRGPKLHGGAIHYRLMRDRSSQVIKSTDKDAGAKLFDALVLYRTVVSRWGHNKAQDEAKIVLHLLRQAAPDSLMLVDTTEAPL